MFNISLIILDFKKIGRTKGRCLEVQKGVVCTDVVNIFILVDTDEDFFSNFIFFQVYVAINTGEEVLADIFINTDSTSHVVVSDENHSGISVLVVDVRFYVSAAIS